jgi:hypothetical protein
MTALGPPSEYERAGSIWFACAYCGAKPQWPCVTGSDARKPARRPHALRRYAYRRDQERIRAEKRGVVL